MGPRLTTRSIFVPFGTTAPKAGFCEITRPFSTAFEYALPTLPRRQLPSAIAFFAARSLWPLTLGTRSGRRSA
jgi:hypothetical protein